MQYLRFIGGRLARGAAGGARAIVRIVIPQAWADGSFWSDGTGWID